MDLNKEIGEIKEKLEKKGGGGLTAKDKAAIDAALKSFEGIEKRLDKIEKALEKSADKAEIDALIKRIEAAEKAHSALAVKSAGPTKSATKK